MACPYGGIKNLAHGQVREVGRFSLHCYRHSVSKSFTNTMLAKLALSRLSIARVLGRMSRHDVDGSFIVGHVPVS